jgi:hypothetical protein
MEAYLRKEEEWKARERQLLAQLEEYAANENKGESNNARKSAKRKIISLL